MILNNSCVVFRLILWFFEFYNFFFWNFIEIIEYTELIILNYAKRPYFLLWCCWISFFIRIICLGDKELNFVATPRMLPFPPRRAALLDATKIVKIIARTIWNFMILFLWFKSSIVLSFKQSARLLYQKLDRLRQHITVV